MDSIFIDLPRNWNAIAKSYTFDILSRRFLLMTIPSDYERINFNYLTTLINRTFYEGVKT